MGNGLEIILNDIEMAEIIINVTLISNETLYVFASNNSNTMYKDSNYVDQEAMLIQSKVHILRIYEKQTQIYLTVEYQNIELTKSDVLIETSMLQNCPKLCSFCQVSKCVCFEQDFGSYCQLQRKNLVLGTQQNDIVKSYEWSYMRFDTLQLGNLTLALKIKYQSIDLIMGLGMDGLQDHEIPNIFYDSYKIPQTNVEQIYNIQNDIIKFKSLCSNCSVLNIGFYNPSKQPAIFYFELQNKLNVKTDKYALAKFIDAIFILIVIILLGMTIKIYNKRQQAFRQQLFRRRIRRIILVDQMEKGFTEQFLQQYFVAYSHVELIKKYPQLAEHVECCVCLEQLGLCQSSQLNEKDDIPLCCVTPCYHMFHQNCLYKWLEKQRCCPLCRKEFDEAQIRDKCWISLGQEESMRETSRINPYIARMKTRSENTQQSDFQFQVEDLQLDLSLLERHKNQQLNELQLTSITQLYFSSRLIAQPVELVYQIANKYHQQWGLKEMPALYRYESATKMATAKVKYGDRKYYFDEINNKHNKTPGPQYKYPSFWSSSQEKSDKKPKEKTFIAENEQRLKRHPVPGPNQYQIQNLNTSFDRKEIRFKHEKLSHRTNHFEDLMATSLEIPGPGQYTSAIKINQRAQIQTHQVKISKAIISQPIKLQS
ncbi:hypothetical protein pb186bvf_002807 [Paramecium bursaria]